MNRSAASTATYWPASLAVRKGVITCEARYKFGFELKDARNCSQAIQMGEADRKHKTLQT